VTDKHCASCTCGRRAPVQGESHGSRRGARAPGTVTWAEHLEAYADYAGHYSGQDADTLARRGGFGYWEMTDHLGHEPKTWVPR
jgi:hypothetical protein